MKSSLSKLKKFCFLLISLFPANLLIAQTAEQLVVYADSQANSGNYTIAIREYSRVLFFSDGKPGQDSLYMKLADCYYAIGENIRATEYYDAGIFISDDPEFKCVVYLKKSRCYIKSGNLAFALIELNNVQKTPGLYDKSEVEFYLGTIYFGLGNYQESELHFSQCLEPADTLEKLKLKEVFFHVKRLKPSRPVVAQVMSLVIPGSGQISGGSVGHGAGSLLLTGALSLLFYNVAVSYSVFDAVISVFPVWWRYYYGGSQNARKITIQRMKKKRDEEFKEILTIIAASK